MASQGEIAGALNSLAGELVERSPFFRAWRGGLVDRAMAERFLVSFDSLVKSFPLLIAAGVERVEGESREVLELNLGQERGEGDPDRSHHAIYRKYLSTAGIAAPDGEEAAFAAEWRAALLDYIRRAPGAPRALGALAAGEFLAQPALSRIYAVIQPLFPRADQEYFTRHLSLETEHMEEITALIARQWGEACEEVLSGFRFGLSVWETYFARLAEFLAEKQPSPQKH